MIAAILYGQRCVVIAWIDAHTAIVTHGGDGRMTIADTADLRIVPNEDFPTGWVIWTRQTADL